MEGGREKMKERERGGRYVFSLKFIHEVTIIRLESNA